MKLQTWVALNRLFSGLALFAFAISIASMVVPLATTSPLACMFGLIAIPITFHTFSEVSSGLRLLGYHTRFKASTSPSRRDLIFVWLKMLL